MELGAEITRLDTADLVEGIARVVTATGATHLFLPHVRTGIVEAVTRRPIEVRLAELLPSVDLHVVAVPT